MELLHSSLLFYFHHTHLIQYFVVVLFLHSILGVNHLIIAANSNQGIHYRLTVVHCVNPGPIFHTLPWSAAKSLIWTAVTLAWKAAVTINGVAIMTHKREKQSLFSSRPIERFKGKEIQDKRRRRQGNPRQEKKLR